VTQAALTGYLQRWELERALVGGSTDLLFVSRTGQPLHPDTITALFHKHVAAAGLPRIRLHDVRHSYATAALKAGVPAKIISERLGHASVALTLQVYSHVLPGMDRDAADTVAALILGGDSESRERDAHRSAHIGAETPLENELTWAKAQVSDGSGGNVLVQDIGKGCLRT
jgi:hypothetical protein